MHDHVSPAISFNSAISSPQELRNLDISSMMSQTKQLHPTYPLSLDFHLHQQTSNPRLSQHSQQHESLLYGYMLSQQQQQQQQHRINEHQHVQHQTNGQRNLLNSLHTQQQQRQQHQQHQHQQHLPHQYEEQYQNHSLQHTKLQEEQNRLQRFKQVIPNNTVPMHYGSNNFPNKSTDLQINTFAGVLVEEAKGTQRESASFHDMDDIDEEMLDEEEEEDLHMYYEQCRHTLLLKHPNVASELLKFAENASMDIQRFFGRAKGEEDACDVYEDKWAATKSGRELYYADLIRIAQGGDTESVGFRKSKKGASLSSTRTSPSTTSSSSASSASYTSSLSPQETDVLDSRTRYTGRRDDSLGMGALSDLFEYGLSDVSASQLSRNTASSSRTRHTTAQRSRVCGSRVAPKMRERSLPKSFWREPTYSISVRCGVNTVTNLDHPHITSISNSKLPDFSDLMESWHGSVGTLVNTGHNRDLAVEVALENQH
ncbi:hypothetical protein RRG08_025226 [Elysia crispata]|uniref:Uncharacterized protein n=1 Tax=Elysia crispata TaxID=231223 RepID=A0AAE1AC90_9GAST|nr:hypothetical protein RRG08_025226 [Elysia crispata]